MTAGRARLIPTAWARRSRDRAGTGPGRGHVAVVDQVPAQRGDVRVEQREPLVDLLLRVLAVLGEHALEQEAQHDLALAVLGRDRRQPAVDEERAEDASPRRAWRPSGRASRPAARRRAATRPSARPPAPVASRLERRERPSPAPPPGRSRAPTACRAGRRVRSTSPAAIEHVQLAPRPRARAGAAPSRASRRVAGRAPTPRHDPQPVGVDERPQARQQVRVHAASVGGGRRRSGTLRADARQRPADRRPPPAGRRHGAGPPTAPPRSARPRSRCSPTTRPRGAAGRRSRDELPAFRERLAAAGIAPLVDPRPVPRQPRGARAGRLRPVDRRSSRTSCASPRRGARRSSTSTSARTAARGVDAGIARGSPTASCRGARDGRRRCAPGGHRSSSRTAPAAGSGMGVERSRSSAGIEAALVGRGRRARSGSRYCLDTAHLWGAGYPIDTPAGVDEVVDAFDAAVGIDRLRMVHLNDSRSERGSRTDRHEHLGAGRIGAAGLAPGARRTRRSAHVVYILETPGMDEGYDAVNIDRARDLAAGRPLADLPPEAFETRSAKGRSAPRRGGRPTTPARPRARDRRRPATPRRRRSGPTRPGWREVAVPRRDPRPRGAARGSPASTQRGAVGRRPGHRHARPARARRATARCRCSARGRRSGRSTTAPSTTTCSRRPRSSPDADPVAVTRRDRAARDRRGRRDVVARPAASAARSPGSPPACSRPSRPAGIDGSTFIWNPNPIPLGRRARVRGGAVRAGRATRALVAARRRSARWSRCSSTCWAVVVVPPLLVAWVAGRSRARRRRGERGAGPASGRASARLAIVAAGYLPLLAYELQHDFAETRAILAYLARRRPRAPRAGALGADRRSSALRSIAWPFAGVITDAPLLASAARDRRRALLAASPCCAGARRPGAAAGSRLARRAPRLWRSSRSRCSRRASPSITPGLPNDHYHTFLDPLVLALRGAGIARVAPGASAVATRARPRGRRESRPSGGPGSAALVVLVAVSVSRWPPGRRRRDGGWPLADEAAGAASLARPDVDAADARRHPDVQERRTRSASRSSAAAPSPLATTVAGRRRRRDVVIVCDPLFEDVVGARCGGPAEEPRDATHAGTGSGAARDRFDGRRARTITVLPAQ